MTSEEEIKLSVYVLIGVYSLVIAGVSIITIRAIRRREDV